MKDERLLKFVAVLRGACWMSVSGKPPSELAAGDGFLLVNASGYVVGSGPGATLRATLDLLDTELARPGIGGSLMTKHLADLLLLQALRAHAAQPDSDSLGWLGALADQHIGAALMHAQPGTRWTVAKLASAVGLSRSSFAARFKARLGVAPLEYLLQWRMQRARHALRAATVPVGRLASLGYASESAFSNAFKRFYGRAPKSYWTAG